MTDVKKWSVTYTKHIHQKRKVYQDGVLELHCSNGTDKVLLYDESEKLLGSRFLKSSDSVGCGETLTFDGYLVDIGDVEKNCNTSSDLDLEGSIKKPPLHGKRAGNNSTSSVESERSGLQTRNRSFVRQIIKKEGEKNSSGSNAAAENHPSGLQNNVTSKYRSFVRPTIKKEGGTDSFGNNAASENYPSGLQNNVSRNRSFVRPIIKKESEKNSFGNNAASENHPSVRYNIKREGEKNSFGNNAASENRPTVRYNIKRENENSCSGNSAALKNHPSGTNNIRSEWNALYTSQKTQKSKKYHDGVVRLVVGVFDRKQVLLYDDSGKQLDSKCLKNDEVVACGETLTFDGYLVDIVDLVENCKSTSDSNIQAGAKIPVENVGRLDESRESGSVNNVAPEYLSRSSITNNVKREWNALYTTQKTQKAKMYHDGVLQLLVGVAQRKQAILLNEDGTILSSRYLSSSEDVRNGSKLELANHLVEIGEEIFSQDGKTQNGSTLVQEVASCSSISNVDRMRFNCSGTRHNSIPHESQSNSSSGKDLGSSSTSFIVEEVKFSQSYIRDVSQILSSLKRPVGENNGPDKVPSLEQINSSQSDPYFPGRKIIEILDEKPGEYLEHQIMGGNDQKIMYKSKISQSEDVEKLSTSCFNDGEELQRHKPSSKNSLGLTESKHPASLTVVSCPEKSAMNPASNAPPSQVSDVFDLREHLQNMNGSVPLDEFENGGHIEKCHLLDAEEIHANSIQDVPDGISKKLCTDTMQIEGNGTGVYDLGSRSSNGSGSCCNSAEKVNSKVFTQVKKEPQMKNFPSFDLGF